MRKLLEAEAGPCELCGLERALQVDHDHYTGKVRGFICGNCNRRLAAVESFLRGEAWGLAVARYLFASAADPSTGFSLEPPMVRWDPERELRSSTDS